MPTERDAYPRRGHPDLPEPRRPLGPTAVAVGSLGFLVALFVILSSLGMTWLFAVVLVLVLLLPEIQSLFPGRDGSSVISLKDPELAGRIVEAGELRPEMLRMVAGPTAESDGPIDCFDLAQAHDLVGHSGASRRGRELLLVLITGAAIATGLFLNGVWAGEPTVFAVPLLFALPFLPFVLRDRWRVQEARALLERQSEALDRARASGEADDAEGSAPEVGEG